jgi:hypothetical protein
MNCKDCKYFTPYVNVDWGMCSHPKLIDDDEETVETGFCPDDGLRATCDEYRGGFYVGPNFGCIHFEQKQ